MAIQKLTVELGQAIVILNFDDNLMRLTSIEITNPTSKKVILFCKSPNWTYTIDAGTTITRNINGSARPIWKWIHYSDENKTIDFIGGFEWSVGLGG